MINEINIILQSLFISLILTITITFIWLKYFSLGIDKTSGIQKIHKIQSLRIGGIIIILSILIASILIGTFNENIWILVLFLPVFIVGVLEDLTQKISIRLRFFSMIVTSFILVINTNAILTNIDIKAINLILSIGYTAIVFTIIGILVTCNAWNFIDGLNGLSSGYSSLVLFSFLILTSEQNLGQIYTLIAITFGVTCGFFIINILTGRVFLGDSGSYFLGMFIGWLGVYIVNNDPNISPWAIFLIIIYPASEITVTVFRRALNIKSPFKPDNKHLHSMVYRLISSKTNLKQLYANSLSGLLILILASIPIFYCLTIKGLYPQTIFSVFISFLIYLLIYYALSISVKKLNI